MNTKGKVLLQPKTNAKTLVNGKGVTGETVLHHNDRVLFGNSHLYVFHHPMDAKKAQDKAPAPTYESAQEEIAENQGNLAGLLGAHSSGSKGTLGT